MIGRMNRRGNWTLSAIFGAVGAGAIIIPLLSKEISNWFVVLGVIFVILAFAAKE